MSPVDESGRGEAATYRRSYNVASLNVDLDHTITTMSCIAGLPCRHYDL